MIYNIYFIIIELIYYCTTMIGVSHQIPDLVSDMHDSLWRTLIVGELTIIASFSSNTGSITELIQHVDNIIWQVKHLSILKQSSFITPININHIYLEYEINFVNMVKVVLRPVKSVDDQNCLTSIMGCFYLHISHTALFWQSR